MAPEQQKQPDNSDPDRKEELMTEIEEDQKQQRMQQQLIGSKQTLLKPMRLGPLPNRPTSTSFPTGNKNWRAETQVNNRHNSSSHNSTSSTTSRDPSTRADTGAADVIPGTNNKNRKGESKEWQWRRW